MQSNRPDRFTEFLDRIEATVADPASVEVIVKIDDTDAAMISLLPHEQARRGFVVKYICGPLPGGFYGLWQSMNDMLEVCDPNAYYVLNLNDEMYFETKGWDNAIRRHAGKFGDDIFRLRTSSNRHRNYIDPWECGFAPESAAFTTRRWIDIGGNWCPCTGPDTFQQMVAYYLAYGDRFNAAKPSRDIAIDEIQINGEGGSHGMTPAAMRERMRGAIGPWFTLMSYPMRTEAFRRAAKLAAHIFAHEQGITDVRLRDHNGARCIELLDATGTRVLRRFDYRLNPIAIMGQNLIRIFNYGYYGGTGNTLGKRIIRNWLGFLCLRFRWLDRIRMAVRHETDGQPGA